MFVEELVHRIGVDVDHAHRDDSLVFEAVDAEAFGFELFTARKLKDLEVVRDSELVVGGELEALDLRIDNALGFERGLVDVGLPALGMECARERVVAWKRQDAVVGPDAKDEVFRIRLFGEQLVVVDAHDFERSLGHRGSPFDLDVTVGGGINTPPEQYFSLGSA